ncbi:MAG: membrane bound o-acyl transferase mboat family protein [Bacteroidetes bacterium]|nr:MAG: membrane bound o-acyl transferase mboat family protein [Bacteroidota bacterium]
MTFVILLALQRLFRMVFNSATFGVFLLLVFFAYWFLFRKSLRLQNFFLVVVSYIFYGWWDWRFLGLIAISSLFDFFIGMGIENAQTQARKKILLVTTLVLNLGLLGFFKYFNFFADSLVALFGSMGIQIDGPAFRILLPVGISFYTFQELSYTIDIYRGKLKATRDPVAFFAFVSFFPQLVAGPIERAKNLLPQFYEPRTFSRGIAVTGLRLMLWGFFKKVVIADRLAKFVDPVYLDPASFDGSSIVLAAVFFHIQVYCDFSGYSDIARGCARLFGFELMKNFDRPIYASSLRDFWRRWHISLTSWFKDYLYVPLGGSHKGVTRALRNIILVFLVSGLWHGAQWSFVIWGLLQGTMMCVEFLLSPKIKLPKIGGFILVTLFTIYTLIFFRAGTFENIAIIHQKIFSSWESVSTLGHNLLQVYGSALFVTILLLVTALFLLADRYQERVAGALYKTNRPVRWAFYYAVLILILLLGVNDNAPNFVYFQF